jgi:hypothetical protein
MLLGQMTAKQKLEPENSAWMRTDPGIRSDNVTTVYYLNEMGGMTSESLNNLAMNIWSWCIDRYLFSNI